MPIIRIIKPNDNTIVGIWKITETLDNLYESVSLSSTSKQLLEARNSRIHKLQMGTNLQIFISPWRNPQYLARNKYL